MRALYASRHVCIIEAAAMMQADPMEPAGVTVFDDDPGPAACIYVYYILCTCIDIYIYILCMYI